jgi:hypothetical protein
MAASSASSPAPTGTDAATNGGSKGEARWAQGVRIPATFMLSWPALERVVFVDADGAFDRNMRDVFNAIREYRDMRHQPRGPIEVPLDAIAERAGLSRSTAQRTIVAMCDQGLLDRPPTPNPWATVRFDERPTLLRMAERAARSRGKPTPVGHGDSLPVGHGDSLPVGHHDLPEEENYQEHNKKSTPCPPTPNEGQMGGTRTKSSVDEGTGSEATRAPRQASAEQQQAARQAWEDLNQLARNLDHPPVPFADVLAFVCDPDYQDCDFAAAAARMYEAQEDLPAVVYNLCGLWRKRVKMGSYPVW